MPVRRAVLLTPSLSLGLPRSKVPTLSEPNRHRRFRSGRNYPPKSFPIISFADPHSLTPMESYRFKNQGGSGHLQFSYLPPPPTCPERSAFFALRMVLRSRGIPFPFIFLRTLLHFFALSQNSTLFFSSNSALLREKHPGWRTPSLHSSLRSSAHGVYPDRVGASLRYPFPTPTALFPCPPAALLASLPASSTIAALTSGG